MTGNKDLEISNRVMDAVILVRETAYHLECQSTEDGTMAVRMLEYDFGHAFKEKKTDDEGNWHLKFPKSAVLYLRSHESASQKLKVNIEFPDSTSAVFQIPVLRVQNYGQEQIFLKNLLFFVPFYMLRYEKELKVIDHTPERLLELKKEIDCLYGRLTKLNQEGKLALGELIDLIELYNKITEYAARETEHVKKEVINMGGQVLELSRERFYREGREEGIASVLYKFMKNKNMSFDDACRLCDIDESSKNVYRKHVENMMKKV